MAEPSLWVTNPRIHTDMRASSFVPHTSHNNGLLSGASQLDHAMRNVLEENARLLNEIEVNILTSQAQKNIELFHRTRRNINCLQQSMSQMPGIMSKMPPLPISVDERLASYVLPASPMTQVLGSSHLKEEPRGW
ncbi:hypothetical protein QOZ80_2AG0138200 [Eleusine coracana subsp. coracana]|nr:hypothetical protein QOZ80_2AG0138200 [Eleusine coracana subsp. coracana]